MDKEKFSRPSSLLFWILWHCLATIIITLIPSLFRFGVPVWALGEVHLMVLVGLAISYFASVFVLTLKTRRGTRIRLSDLISTISSVFGSFFLLLLVTGSSYSRSVLLSSLVLTAIFILLSVSLKPSFRTPALFIVAATIVLAPFGGSITEGIYTAALLRPEVETRLIPTTFYNLKAIFYRNYFDSKIPGGGLSTLGDGYLLATGEGALHYVSWNGDNDSLTVGPLLSHVPLNRDDFVSDVGGAVSLLPPELGDSSGSDVEKSVRTDWFRVADILVQDLGDAFRLFVVHHYWKSEQHCFVVRVSVTEANYGTVMVAETPLEWQTLYETEPCLSLKKKGHPFAGLQIGGRLVLLDDHRLLLSVGDHEFDGLNSVEVLPQDKKVAYGKTVLIDLETGASEIYSIGHRNSQGLYRTPLGAIWLTEHGPKGGDELNLIVKGANYGWPLVTYGTNYYSLVWPLSVNQGRHQGFETPMYAWLPSIGISNLVGVEKQLFKLWQNDLLVSSMTARRLWRVRVRKQHVVYVESIKIDERIRDIIEDNEGRIVLWTDQGSIVFIEPVVEKETHAEEDNTNINLQGELLFANCRGCHEVENGTAHGIGPDLWGVAGRRIATARDYRYSEALKSVPGTWSEERLDAFLANPQSFAPGTSMQLEGLSDPTSRARLVEYLKRLK